MLLSRSSSLLSAACCSGGPAVVQADCWRLPVGPRWFQLFSGGCRWPRGDSSCFPVVTVGPAVIQAVLLRFPLLFAGCRWPRGGSSGFLKCRPGGPKNSSKMLPGGRPEALQRPSRQQRPFLYHFFVMSGLPGSPLQALQEPSQQ